MSWAKFDDRYHGNRKIRRAWKANRASVGLHAMAVTYCAQNETNGVVDLEWIEEKLPSPAERERVLGALLDTGLFESTNTGDGGYLVHDFLVYNQSHAEAEEKRAAKKASQKKWRDARHGDPSESNGSPSPREGVDDLTALSGESLQAISGDPAPARPFPDPTRPIQITAAAKRSEG